MLDTGVVLRNLNECIKELASVNKSFAANPQTGRPGTQDPGLIPSPLMKDYKVLLEALKSYGQALPPLYQSKVVKPLCERLEKVGPELFLNPMIQYPGGCPPAKKVWLAAEAVFQHSLPNILHKVGINAFQEMVTDLYDSFLSNARKHGLKPPDNVILPPLARSAAQDIGGPMTMPVDEMLKIGVESAVVYFPPEYMGGGLLAWSCWSHEVGGHDILHAHHGVLEELSNAIANKIKERIKEHDQLVENWAKLRIDETASDILGILNMGPMAAFGFIGFFRAMSLAKSQQDSLNRFTFIGSSAESDSHPTPLFRAHLAVSTLRQLNFKGANEWAQIIDEMINTVCPEFCSSLILITDELVPITVSRSRTRELTDIIAETVIKQKLNSLGGNAFGDIQKWNDQDENIVSLLRPVLYAPWQQPLPVELEKGYYAAHVVAAATLEMLLGEYSPLKMQGVFNGMMTLLNRMHLANDSWGQQPYKPIVT